MNILYLAPDSYPITGSECISNVKVAYVLAELGHHVIVYALSNGDSIYPEASLKALNHENIEIRYVPYEGDKEYGLYHAIHRRYNRVKTVLATGYYYGGNDIAYHYWKAIEKSCDLSSIDLMITRRRLTEIAGININKKYGIPWIANWNDPYPEQMFPPPYGNGPSVALSKTWCKLLDEIQKRVAIHTFPSSRLRNYMMEYMPLINIEKTYVIPHIAHSMFSPKVKEKNVGKLRMLHAGAVGYPRNPSSFLKALSIVVHKYELKKSIECLFVGKVSQDFLDLVKELDLEDNVTYRKGMPYFEVLKLQNDFDLSLVIEADCKEGIYLPTKVVDSIQGKLPVFCVSPSEGTLRDLVNTMEIGYSADVSNVDDIVNTLKMAVDDFVSDRFPKISQSSCSYFFEDYAAVKYQEIINVLVK